jgi:hypothetical protein
VAQFDAAELITQREVVSARIRQDLLNRAKEFNILLEDVSIVSWFVLVLAALVLGRRRSWYDDKVLMRSLWFPMNRHNRRT